MLLEGGGWPRVQGSGGQLDGVWKRTGSLGGKSGLGLRPPGTISSLGSAVLEPHLVRKKGASSGSASLPRYRESRIWAGYPEERTVGQA